MNLRGTHGERRTIEGATVRLACRRSAAIDWQYKPSCGSFLVRVPLWSRKRRAEMP
jgi:hypothetical protein